MPTIKLTKRAISALPAPDPSGKQVLVWDADLKGFGVLVSGKTKAKTFVVQRKLAGGLTRRMTVVTEFWLKGTWLEHDAWTEREQTLALLARKIEIGSPGFAEANYRIGGVGLHALARRYERCADRSDHEVLTDLAALVDGYPA